VRPVELAIEGFGTFAAPTTVSFEGVDVFALVGATGAGKSTVIDAMCFALYGSIPRYDDRRTVGAAVHAQAMEAKVSLTFELSGTRYVAVRVVRKDAKGKASTKDARLERADGEVLAGTAREMDAAVPTLLGLDFDQFTRAVVLPQGDFARFLHDKPAGRQDLLKSLLGLDVYERMMQRARTTARDEAVAVARDQDRITALAHATPEARAELTKHADTCADAVTRWQTARAVFEELTASTRAAEARVADARRRIDALEAMEAPTDLAELSASLQTARHAETAATAAREIAGKAVETADRAVATGGDRDALIRARDAYARVDQLSAEHADLAAQVQSAARAASAAVDDQRAAEVHLEAQRTANAAFAVREHLVAGEPCPVCEQLVATVPAVDAPEAWQAARAAAEAAAQAAAIATKRHTKAEAAESAVERQLAKERAAIVGAPAPADLVVAIAAMDQAAAAATAARAAEQQARRTERDAKAARERTEAALGGARTALRDARDSLTALGLTPPPEAEDLAVAWDALAAFVAVEIPVHEGAAHDAATAADATRTELHTQLAAVAREATTLGVRVGADAGLDDLVAAATGEVRVAGERIERLDAELAERNALVAATVARSAHAEVAAELARLLDANHFERWLVSEALTRLVDGGSERFHALSAGRYSFGLDDTARDILVVDHHQGDERRSVRTLSGGETFQASLALALALSDQLADLAADGAARLESIFLDEGFGTLDAETLETVAATIENLAAGDRMVGIVTHVAELAARMPVQFRVTKHGPTSQVERIDT